MRLLLFALLSRAAGEITWHVGSTGQSCDVTCTSLNPSKSCALDSYHAVARWPGMQISPISLRPTETTSPASLSVAEAPERVCTMRRGGILRGVCRAPP